MQTFTIATQFRRAYEDKVAGEIVIETIEVEDLNAASAYAAEVNADLELPFFIRSVVGDNGQYVRFFDPLSAAVPTSVEVAREQLETEMNDICADLQEGGSLAQHRERMTQISLELDALPEVSEEPLFDATVRFFAEDEAYGTARFELRAPDEASAIRLAGERAERESIYADPRIDYRKEVEIEQIEGESLPLAA